MSDFTNEIFLRPRFRLELPTTKEELLNRFTNYLATHKVEYPYKLVDAHIFIDIPEKHNHFWSPQLHLEVIEEDDKTILKGLFGPKPQVWTLFMFIHFVVAMTFIVFATIAYINSTLDKSNFLSFSMLIALPLIWLLLYALGRIGKDTGKKQMKQLQEFTLKVLNEK